MALKILLADPDVEWLQTAQAWLEENLYEVDTATIGKEAQLAVYNNRYFAVVLNLDLQDHPGLMVMKFIKSNHPSQKVIIT